MMLSRSAHSDSLEQRNCRNCISAADRKPVPISFPVHIPKERFRASKPKPKTNRQEEEFLFNKENAPEASWGEEEEGKAFPGLYRGKGRALGVNRAGFCLLPL